MARLNQALGDMAKIMRWLLTCVFLSLLTVDAIGDAGPTASPTLLQLLADPAKYHNSKVVVLGYCRLEFEGKAIHLNKEDYVQGLGNMVWLEVARKDITPAREKITYCLVAGTYNAKNRGHKGMFSGAIEQITRYQSWPARSSPNPS